MSRPIEKLPFPPPPGREFDEIIDVRTPSEFAEDHVSGAVNLPVLGDGERARVGTLYKRDSPFAARRLGAALVSANIARHLEAHFADKGPRHRPLLYCWRGGLRSESFAEVLSRVGWAAAVVEGGYRSYRRHVVATLARRAAELDFVVLDGFTGAGKTRVLRAVEERGGQALDLEGLARHKGSVFGGDTERPQPGQKRFESLLCDRLAAFEGGAGPVFIEAESAKIGRLNLPNPLWQRMKSAPVVELDSPLEARAAHLLGDYREWLEDPGRVADTLERLRPFHSRRTVEEWSGLAAAGAWGELVARLLAEHYDRRYPASGKGHFQAPFARLELPRHDEAAVAECAAALMELARRTGGE